MNTSANAKISAILADDHALSSQGLQQALEATGRITVVEIVSNGIDAITAVRRLGPAIAVLDYAMPQANGLEAHIEIKRWAPQTRTALVTGQSRPEIIGSLVARGVDGVFQKSMPVEDLVNGIIRVAQGETVHPALTAEVTLSAREFEVLYKVAEGLSVRDTADALSLSPKTIETHKASLMRKLGVNSSAALIVAAVKQGLLDLG